MDAKPAIKSKTLWFNGIGAALTALEAFTNAFDSVLPGKAHIALLAISIGGNAILRFYTTGSITSK